MVYMIYSNISDNISLTKNGVYIIGNIEKINPASGGHRVYVNYKCRNKMYYSDFIDANWSETNYKLGRYAFKIDSLSPHSYDIEYKYHLPDNVILDSNREYSNLYYFDSLLFGIRRK